MDELNLMNLLLFLASQNSTGGSGGGCYLATPQEVLKTKS